MTSEPAAKQLLSTADRTMTEANTVIVTPKKTKSKHRKPTTSTATSSVQTETELESDVPQNSGVTTSTTQQTQAIEPSNRSTPSPSIVSSTYTYLIRRTLVLLLAHFLPYILFFLFLSTSISFFRSTFYSFLAPFSSALSAINLERLSHLSSIASVYYCSTIGIGCKEYDGMRLRKEKRPIGGMARTVRVQAVQAMDLFDSVLQLSGSNSVESGASSLHHVALWELATAIKHTSSIDSRNFLGNQVKELGDLTRDVKDQVIRLNSIGISSFTWIVQQFSRLEEILEKAVNSGGSGKGEGLEKMLDSLFEKISEDLEVLLVALDKALPLADEASFLGGRVADSLSAEYSRIQKETEDVPLWKSLVDRQSWKGKQLRRDLELSRESVEWVKDVRMGLENTRSQFVEYQANVGGFKAGMVGYHLAGHGLSASDEITSLKNVMNEFRSTLVEVKQSRRSGVPRSKLISGVAAKDDDGAGSDRG